MANPNETKPEQKIILELTMNETGNLAVLFDDVLKATGIKHLPTIASIQAQIIKQRSEQKAAELKKV